MASEGGAAEAAGQEWVVLASFENRHAAEQMLLSLGRGFRKKARKGGASAFVVGGNKDGSLKLTESRVLEAGYLTHTLLHLSFAARKPLTTRRAAGIIASVTLSITIISGVLMHFTDKKTYPNIGDGMWWAIQTVTTVGDGDFVATSTIGRLVAALVMLAGIGS